MQFIFNSTAYRVTAIAFVVLIAFACFCIFRAIKRWNGLSTWRRVYAAVTVGLSSAMLVAFVVQVAKPIPHL